METPPPNNPNGQEAAAPESQSVQAPSISLPKGGGAIKGIGEKFGVNPVNGTGTLSVPIFTTPGRSKFTPNLSLSYDSGAGNGPFGFGWRLSVPSITRKTDKGLPRYFDGEDSDVFILSDAEDLMPAVSLQGNQWLPVPVPDGTWSGQPYAIKRYRPRIEGLFARIERWQRRSDGDTHWRATTKDNITSIYGRDPSCRIADPADASRVFKWLLEATYDAKGNVIYYKYKPEDSNGVNPAAANEHNRWNGIAPCTNAYIKCIHYGNWKTAYDPGEDLSQRSDWLFQVAFDYGEYTGTPPGSTAYWATRADPFSSFRSTFDIRTYRLCQRVLMFHNFPAYTPPAPAGADVPTPSGPPATPGYVGIVRSTDFAYDSSGASSSLQGNPIATKLISITQTGYNPLAAVATPAKSFPPLEFTYSEAEINPTVHTVDPGSLQNLPIGVNGSNYQWLDLDGEGLVGILTQQAEAMFYKRNLSPANIAKENGGYQTRARFGPLERVASQPDPVAAGMKPQFMDLAADGRQDLVRLEGQPRGFYERAQWPTWQSFRPFESFPNLDTRDPNLKFVDVVGDGLTDILVSEDEVFAWYRGLGHCGFGERQYARKPFDEERGAALVFNDPTQSIFLADMTGDGLSDIVRIRNGEACYWPNRGYGRFGAKVTMDNAPCFDTPDLFDPRRIRLADIDGCGTTDILYLAARGVAIYHNQSGNSWSQEVLLPDVPPINDIASISTTDLLGNGTACLVWSSPLPADAGRQMQYMDLMGSVKPHLLITIKNNLGAETRVRYASSNKFYVQERENGIPWVTRLPFPVYVVERAEVFDYIGRKRLVTTYRYRHGYFDGVEREFRGFGYVEQRDAETFSDSGSLFTEKTDPEADALKLPPVVTKTWFHTGAWPNPDTTIHHMAHEYYRAPARGDPRFAQDWSTFMSWLLPDTILPSDVLAPNASQQQGVRTPYALSGEEQREAVRALKGSILRQEIYAEDGTAEAAIPYSVSERNYTVECLQPQGENLYAVFFNHARETIDYHYERNPADPRVSHDVVLQADPYGNVLQSISIGYGRNLNAPSVQLAPDTPAGTSPDLTTDATTFAQPEQATALLTLTVNTVTNALDDPDTYRTPMPAETCIYEVTRLARADDSAVYAFSDLQTLASTALINIIPFEQAPDPTATQTDPTATQARLVGDVRTLYWNENLSGAMGLGQLGSLGLVYQTYEMAFTQGLAPQVFINDNSNPNKPSTGSTSTSTSGTNLNTLLSVNGGYINWQGSTAPGDIPDQNWWVPSGITTYSATQFYLPVAHTDPFGNTATFAYDGYCVLLFQTQDPLGNTVTAQNDYRVLQPTSVTDPNQNVTEVCFDVLGMLVGTAVEGKVTTTSAGTQVIESGDSLSSFIVDLTQGQIDGFITSADPAKLLAPGLLGMATTRVIYDLDRFSATQSANPTDPTQWKPVFAATIARETHGSQTSKMQLSFSFSDGLGREIQKKSQAAPDPTLPQPAPPRWIGSGWVVLNNKGKPVRQYEPFFSSTQDFEFANKVGVTPTLFYDPLERVVVTLRPNNTYEKVIFDPWRQETWDTNDTVNLDPQTDPDVQAYVRSFFAAQPSTWQTWLQATGVDPNNPPADGPSLPPNQAAAVRALKDVGTPTAACFDPLARTFLTVADNGLDDNGNAQFYATRTDLDIQGNQLSVTDALGRVVMQYDYDMLKTRLYQNSVDAGERWMLNDVRAKPIYRWDSRGHVFQTQYDALRRPVRQYVLGAGSTSDPRTLAGATTSAAGYLFERTVYGEAYPDSSSSSTGPTTAQSLNLRGRVFMQLDMAGAVTNQSYDFKGNLLANYRQVLADFQDLHDWSSLDSSLLEAASLDTSAITSALNPLMEGDPFPTSTTYDALNRPISVTSPDRSVTVPTYNEARWLQTVTVTLPDQSATAFVSNIDYNSKGQRVSITYGNGVGTAYTYDSETFRLTRILTTNPPPQTNPLVTSPAGANIFQDLDYTYDPVGNVTTVKDDAQQTIFFSGQIVQPRNDYDYDAIYRLLSASGREHIGQVNQPQTTWNDSARMSDHPFPSPKDRQAMQNYTENYEYDPVGNFLSLAHVATVGSWKRKYVYDAPNSPPTNNHLTSTTVGATTENYGVPDPNGNMANMFQLQGMQWDFKDQLQMTQQLAVNNGPAPKTYYVYDSTGQRVRKVNASADGSIANERIYLGGYEVYYDGGTTLETLHVMDDKQRVALAETLTEYGQISNSPIYRYQFSDHLGSSLLELNGTGKIISYEEYYPYGSTSYQAVDSQIDVNRKRYRYTGKERDEESGFYYHGARYYAPWLGRWISADPAGWRETISMYTYCHCNPVTFKDSNGRYAEAGHYYTVLLVSLAAGFDLKTSFRNAFFAQLPDKVQALDAVSQFFQAVSGDTQKAGDTDRATKQMGLTQQGLHGLTGGEAQAERGITEQALSKASAGTMEFGFLLHRLGDTYAHTTLRDPTRLYPTGIGHGFDLHRPDEIFQRPDLYVDYAMNMFDILVRKSSANGGAPAISKAELRAMLTHMARSRAITGQNDENGDPMIDPKATDNLQISMLNEMSRMFRILSGKGAENDMSSFSPKGIQSLQALQSWASIGSMVKPGELSESRIDKAVHNVDKAVGRDTPVDIRFSTNVGGRRP